MKVKTEKMLGNFLWWIFGVLSTLLIFASYNTMNIIKTSKDKIIDAKIETTKISEPFAVYHSGGYSTNYSEIVPMDAQDFIGLSSPYGLRRSPISGNYEDHKGLDFYGVWNSRVTAVGKGKVIEHWVPTGKIVSGVRYKGHSVYGGMLKIKMEKLYKGKSVEVLYAHLSDTFLNSGDTVNKDSIIGRQGSTGRSSGQHVHIEVFVGGKRMNPLTYLNNYAD